MRNFITVLLVVASIFVVGISPVSAASVSGARTNAVSTPATTCPTPPKTLIPSMPANAQVACASYLKKTPPGGKSPQNAYGGGPAPIWPCSFLVYAWKQDSSTLAFYAYNYCAGNYYSSGASVAAMHCTFSTGFCWNWATLKTYTSFYYNNNYTCTPVGCNVATVVGIGGGQWYQVEGKVSTFDSNAYGAYVTIDVEVHF